MTDLRIHDIDPTLKSELEKRARVHGRSLSDEAKAVLRRGLEVPEPDRKLGTWLCSLVRPEDRGDDLVFEYPGMTSSPPTFE